MNNKVILIIVGISLIFFAKGNPFLYANIIHVQNEIGGFIWLEDGKSKDTIGQVLEPGRVFNYDGFRASQWGKKGSVTAISSNAIHLLFSINKKTNQGNIISIVPKEYQNNLNDRVIHSNYGVVKTDIPSGIGIFRDESPFVGNLFFIKRDNKVYKHVPEDYIPERGDEWLIEIPARSKGIREIIFENKYNGKVASISDNGFHKDIARVLRPVVGIGRFEGSQYMPYSRIRANHPGVICISTSPVGDLSFPEGIDKRGGFQIIPSIHAMDDEMIVNTFTQTQWMVVAPLFDEKEPLEGKFPLFSGLIRPGMKVEMRIDGGNWEELPKYYGKNDIAFTPRELMRYFYIHKGESRIIKKGLTHLRILLCDDVE